MWGDVARFHRLAPRDKQPRVVGEVDGGAEVRARPTVPHLQSGRTQCGFRPVGGVVAELGELTVPTYVLKTPHPRVETTVSCSVSRAPREYEGLRRQ